MEFIVLGPTLMALHFDVDEIKRIIIQYDRGLGVLCHVQYSALQCLDAPEFLRPSTAGENAKNQEKRLSFRLMQIVLQTSMHSSMMHTARFGGRH